MGKNNRPNQSIEGDFYQSAWSALFTNDSIPFEKPSKGKIAVKVINHHGDEVLKVYDV